MKNLITILFLAFFATASFAQNMLAEDMPEGVELTESYQHSETPMILSVSNTFTGFKIQIAVEETSLEEDHELLSGHTSITVERIESQYHYTVGDFASIYDAAKMKYDLSKFNESVEIIEYVNGKRVSQLLEEAKAN